VSIHPRSRPGGIIDLEKNQLLATPFLDISGIVNVSGLFGDERGREMTTRYFRSAGMMST
jgi:hypothetical protein